MSEKPTVLIVDDDISMLKMAGELLREEFAVSFADSGAELLRLVGSGFVPDIILLDLLMPEMNGFEAFEALRKIDFGKDIPVIFLTGEKAAASETHALCIGAADYIKKPFVREILLARMRLRLETAKKLSAESVRFAKICREYSNFTPTEEKVLRLLCQNYTNREIAGELHYSLDYVKKVVSRIFIKLGVKRRDEIKNIGKMD